ncbi:MAG: hypothetical protein HS115_06215 [Spirochaetales bacterium]|nr:hypothetical protein [Spirochaetales bacterium]
MKELYFLPAIFLITFSALPAAPEKKKAEVVFEKWIAWQKVCPDMDLSKLGLPSTDRLLSLEKRWNPELKEQTRFLGLAELSRLPAGEVADSKALTLTRSNINKLWQLIDKDTPGFVAWLKSRGFLTPELNQKEKSRGTSQITEKYRSFIEDLLPELDPEVESCALIAVANRFFEYSFSRGGHEKLAASEETYPLLRMLYAIMWYHLSGTGWKNWHAHTLHSIGKENEEIAYIAGGSDLYLPLKHGLKRLHLIDPQLPTQTKYYAEGWQFLLRGSAADGGLGDEIDLGKILLRRSAFRAGPAFKLGEHSIPASETRWDILQSCVRGHCPAGQIRLDRRPVVQADFSGDRTYLISFNELYYVAAADSDGWGIDPEKFPDSIRMLVKQLRRPLGKRELTALRATRDSNFSYIKLGTSVD